MNTRRGLSLSTIWRTEVMELPAGTAKTMRVSSSRLASALTLTGALNGSAPSWAAFMKVTAVMPTELCPCATRTTLLTPPPGNRVVSNSGYMALSTLAYAQADVPCPAGGGSGNVQFLFSGGVSGKGS